MSEFIGILHRILCPNDNNVKLPIDVALVVDFWYL